MAVVSQNQADQENQNSQSGTSQNNTQTGGNGVTTVVSGSRGAGGASSNAAPTVQNAQGSQNSASGTPSSSGSFTNLKSYLNANNGGQNFTQQINNNLGQQGQNIQSNVNNATQQFNQQAQSVVNPYQTDYQNYNQNGGATSNASQIANYAQDNNHANSVRNLEKASYTGPKALTDLAGNNNGNAIQSNINNFSSLANNTGTEAGRFSLLQNMFGGQGYNQGQQTLDNVFIDPSKLSGARSTANQVQNAYTQAANNAQNQGQNYQNQISDIAHNTIGSLNNAVYGQNQGSALSNINNDYQKALGTQTNNFNQYNKDLQAGKISQSEANNLGLKSGMDIYNVDPSQYLAKAALNTNNTATTQDYSQVAALNNLLGQNANFPASQVLSQYAQAQAAVDPNKYLNYDATGLTNAAQHAGQSYQDTLNQNFYGHNGLADAINSLMPLVNLGNLQQAGGNILLDPKTMQGATFAQLGDTGVSNNFRGSPYNTAAYNDMMNYYKGQGYQTGQIHAALNDQQQQQLDSYQRAIKSMEPTPDAAKNNAAEIQQYQGYINNLKNSTSTSEQITDPNFYNKVSPLDFFKSVINGTGGVSQDQFRQDLGGFWTPGASQAMDAIATLVGAANTYTPTRQLQINPDEATS